MDSFRTAHRTLNEFIASSSWSSERSCRIKDSSRKRLSPPQTNLPRREPRPSRLLRVSPHLSCVPPMPLYQPARQSRLHLSSLSLGSTSIPETCPTTSPLAGQTPSPVKRSSSTLARAIPGGRRGKSTSARIASKGNEGRLGEGCWSIDLR